MKLKDDIFNELAANKGKDISGQELAEKFGVSRNAVWKAVNELKKDGISISSAQNRGYRVSKNILSQRELEKSFPKEMKLFYYESTDSTNSQAKRLISGGFSSDAAVVANEQTAGRGRCGRDFYSPKDTGIYISFIFHPKKELADAVFITTAAAVAVLRAVERLTGANLSIKWVNDVYRDGKKICGILTEGFTDFESGTLESVIVGIGINFDTAVFPESIKDRAASLNAAGITREELIAALGEEFIKIAYNLDDETILSDYRSHSFIIGKKISFIKNGVSEFGTALEIDGRGGLKVRTQDGAVLTLNSGEITVRAEE